jgi:hypothetical protein
MNTPPLHLLKPGAPTSGGAEYKFEDTACGRIRTFAGLKKFARGMKVRISYRDKDGDHATDPDGLSYEDAVIIDNDTQYSKPGTAGGGVYSAAVELGPRYGSGKHVFVTEDNIFQPPMNGKEGRAGYAVCTLTYGEMELGSSVSTGAPRAR